LFTCLVVVDVAVVLVEVAVVVVLRVKICISYVNLKG